MDLHMADFDGDGGAPPASPHRAKLCVCWVSMGPHGRSSPSTAHFLFVRGSQTSMF